jgi:hypothetical protein
MRTNRRFQAKPDPHAIMRKCFFCGRLFQFGPHVYDGSYSRYYKIEICRSCYQGNWDGYGLDAEEKLLQHMADNGIVVPARNKKGWLPRDP